MTLQVHLLQGSYHCLDMTLAQQLPSLWTNSNLVPRALGKQIPLYTHYHFMDCQNMKVRVGHQRCSVGKIVLRNFTKFKGKHLCQSLFFNKVARLRPATLLEKIPRHRCQVCSFIKKETLTQVFSSDFCKISKNTFFIEHLCTTASVCIFNLPLIFSVLIENEMSSFSLFSSSSLRKEWKYYNLATI